MRKICYISGTRADFGLMKSTLMLINSDKYFDLSLILTGMHLIEEYGFTWKEIEDCGLNIIGEVLVKQNGSSGEEMLKAFAKQVDKFTNLLKANKPDLLLLLGDRGEMLAGAIVALHLNIPIVHIHGGELSGTIDDSIRHSITKLAHYHLVSTLKSQERLIKLGEHPKNIFITGAPGLDEIYKMQLINRKKLLMKYNLSYEDPYLLFLFHPVVQQINSIKSQIDIILTTVVKSGIQVLILLPNSDSGSSLIKESIKSYEDKEKIHIITHAKRLEFLSLSSHAEVLIGNSSSGIIEAASLGIPVLNIGDRQKYRERNDNTIDVGVSEIEIEIGLNKALKMNKSYYKNIYGDGNSSFRIINVLKKISLDGKVLEKINAY
jgi:GDP/UDP-N,N'-diacetylbacillosamine 2-epimerase (hydrolysing)